MSRLPALRSRDVLRVLERAGFIVHHVTGKHYILKHPTRAGLRVTLPWHNKDLKRGTLRSVVEQAGYAIDGFVAPFITGAASATLGSQT